MQGVVGVVLGVGAYGVLALLLRIEELWRVVMMVVWRKGVGE